MLFALFGGDYMWITEQKNGGLSAVERYKDPLSGKYKTVSVKILRNTAQERKKATTILTQRIEKLTHSHEDIRLCDMIEKYLEFQKRDVKEQTLIRNRAALERVRDILGGDNYVSRITALYIKEQFNASGKSATTLNEYLKRFKSCYRWAFRSGLVTSTAAIDGVTPYKEDLSKKEKIKDKYLERDEIRLLLEAMTHQEWRLLTEFLILTGMRIGEVTSLLDQDVTAEEINIDKTYSQITNKSNDTKTFDSTRVIHIQPELAKCIKKIRTFMKRRKWMASVITPLFWHDTTGNVLHYDAYRMYLERKTQQVLGRKLPPHALRHTHASLLAETMPLEAIMRRLGHSDSEVTKQIYIHVTKEVKKRDSQMLDSANFMLI